MSTRAAVPDSRDWDLRLPEFVLYAAPVALALFCLFLSQANDVVFWGFEEDEPATPLSTALMVACFVIALAAVRRSDLPRPMRIVGGLMALLAGVAALDENFLWHEALGRLVQKEVSSLPRSLTWYTDDAVVLLGALLGGFVVYRCIRYVSRACETPRQRIELLPYLGCAVAVAVAHGVLDVASHSHFVVDRVWPQLSEASAGDYVERLGYFEEICKLWAEWFVVLLLLKLLHGQRGPLVWSALALIGNVLAVLGGLWGVDDVAAGIPCLTLGEPLAFLRNFHSLFALAWIWTAWIAMLRVCCRRAPERGEFAGLLLVVPLAPVLGGLLDPRGLGRAVGTIAGALMPDAYYGASVARHGLLLVLLVVPGLIVGFVAGRAVRRWPHTTGIAIAAGCAISWSWRQPSLATSALLAVPGAVVIASLVPGRRRRTALLIAGVLAVASVTASAWWAIGALTWAVFVWAGAAPIDLLRRRAAVLLAVAVVQIVLGVSLMIGTAPRIIPNYEWEPRPWPAFRVIQEPFEHPSPR